MLVVACSSNHSVKATPTVASKPAEIVIESSHGKSVIQPTVVDYSAANKTNSIENADFSDPLEFINRPIFTFNDYLYRYFLTPLSRGYQYITPDPVEQSITNAF